MRQKVLEYLEHPRPDRPKCPQGRMETPGAFHSFELTWRIYSNSCRRNEQTLLGGQLPCERRLRINMFSYRSAAQPEWQVSINPGRSIKMADRRWGYLHLMILIIIPRMHVHITSVCRHTGVGLFLNDPQLYWDQFGAVWVKQDVSPGLRTEFLGSGDMSAIFVYVSAWC